MTFVFDRLHFVTKCIKAGVDVLSHAAYLVWEASPFVPASYRSVLSIGFYRNKQYRSVELKFNQ